MARHAPTGAPLLQLVAQHARPHDEHGKGSLVTHAAPCWLPRCPLSATYAAPAYGSVLRPTGAVYALFEFGPQQIR